MPYVSYVGFIAFNIKKLFRPITQLFCAHRFYPVMVRCDFGIPYCLRRCVKCEKAKVEGL